MNTVEQYARHVNPAFVKLLGLYGYGRVFVKAKGTTITDDHGREYSDFLAGFGAVSAGHNHPRLVERLRGLLAENALAFSHVGPGPYVAMLAEALSKRAGNGLEVALLSNAGSEAVEAAIKLARAATKRSGVVYARGGFHGTSLGTLSIMGAPRMRKPFEPLLAGCEEVPFGDLAALDRALAKKPSCFVVEPIQGEAGVVLPPAGYLAAARDLCRGAGALFVLDEVQTGIGRTGSMFAFEAENAAPDVLVLAKGLSGGMMPIGATLTTREWLERAYGTMARFDLHGSTFGGHAAGCVAALETLSIVDDEKLVARASENGARWLSMLRARLAGHPLVRDVRGRGLMIAVELGATGSGVMQKIAPGLIGAVAEKVAGQWIALRLLEAGFVAQPASHRWDTLKLMPPLTVETEQLDRIVASLGSILDEYRTLAPLARDVAARLREQQKRRWAFR